MQLLRVNAAHQRNKSFSRQQLRLLTAAAKHTLRPNPTDCQKGVKNVISTGRNVPDIAFDANPGSGAAFYYNGAFSGPIGGTSLASPIFAAFVAENNQVHGKRSGLINTAIYARFKQVGYGTQFRDITLGNNSFFGPGYKALPGYDQVTGIGSIVGWPYAK